MLQHYKQALALRRQNPLLRSGAMSNIDVIGDAISFQRRGGSGEAIYCAFNLGETPVTLTLPGGGWQLIGDTPDAKRPADRIVQLGAWQVCLAKSVQGRV